MPHTKKPEDLQNDAEDQVQEPRVIQTVTPPSHPTVFSVHPEWTQICVVTRAGGAITYDLPNLDIEEEKSILKDPLLVPNHVAYSPTGSLIGCACRDGNVVLVSTVVEGAAPKKCTPPHSDGPAIGVCFDPENSYIFSVSSTGIGHVYDVSDGTIVAEVPGLFMPIKLGSSGNDDDESDANSSSDGEDFSSVVRPVWSHDGSFIAVPGGKEIAFVERDTWRIAFRLGDKEHMQRTGLVTWCPNDLYVASCSVRDGVIIIWDLKGKESVIKVSVPHTPVLGLDWSPVANTIIMLCGSGKYALWKEVISKSLAAPNRRVVSTAVASISEAPADTTSLLPSSTQAALSTNNNTTTTVTADVTAPLPPPVNVDEPLETAHSSRKKEVKREYDSGSEASSIASKRYRYDNYGAGEAEETRQEPFQPAASPFNKKRRFLAFNHLGTVVSKEQDSDLVLVIEPVDREMFSKQVLVDHHRCTMGSLSKKIIIIIIIIILIST